MRDEQDGKTSSLIPQPSAFSFDHHIGTFDLDVNQAALDGLGGFHLDDIRRPDLSGNDVVGQNLDQLVFLQCYLQ